MKTPIRFKIETITPVAIGDAQVISPLSDYIYDNHQIHWIDKTEFENLLLKKNKITEYVEGVRNASNANKADFLQNFIHNKLGVKDYKNEDLKLINLSIPSVHLEAPIEIKTVIKNAVEPYISGSTLKGAIKTALLYHWLIGKGKKELDTILRLLNINDKNLAKETERIIDLYLNAKTIEGVDEFAHLKLSDTMNNDFQVQIEKVDRIRLIPINLPQKNKNGYGKNQKEKTVIPILSETIEGQAELCIELLPNFQHSHLQTLNQENALVSLFQILNTFAKALVQNELQILQEKANSQFKEDTNPILLYNRLLEEIQKDNQTAYLCIGFGKTFYHQSIGLALGDTKLVTKYVRLIGLQKSKEAQLYPITRNFTTDFQPLGWVKISLKP